MDEPQTYFKLYNSVTGYLSNRHFLGHKSSFVRNFDPNFRVVHEEDRTLDEDAGHYAPKAVTCEACRSFNGHTKTIIHDYY